MTDAVSHGRGGAGNINPDDTKYVDGTIHREEDPATLGGSYSTGRGGGGNIASPGLRPVSRGDGDVIPEVAKVITREEQGYHSGRGGEGNAHHVPETAEKPTEVVAKKSVIDRLKEKLKALFPKPKESKP